MANYHRSLYLLLVAILLTAGLSAQDIHFSQFYMSPLNLNPAMTGVMNETQRVTVNYRNQWAGAVGSSAYNTYAAGYDRRIPVGREDNFGIGGSLWSDVAGESKFGSTQAKLSFSFSKKIAGTRKKAHYLTVGADGGFTQRRVRTGDLRWLSQVNNNGVYDPSQGSPEAIPNNNFTYADLSLGMLWFSNLGERTNLFVGGSLHHLNEPQVSFLSSDEQLYQRLTLHAGGEYPINTKISIKPNFIFMSQGPHKEVNGGASARFKVKSKNGFGTTGQFFELGAWYRVGTKFEGGVYSDAVILAARLDYDQYGIGFSYDYNVSELGQASPGNGSFELSLIYRMDEGGRRAVFCPVF